MLVRSVFNKKKNTPTTKNNNKKQRMILLKNVGFCSDILKANPFDFQEVHKYHDDGYVMSLFPFQNHSEKKMKIFLVCFYFLFYVLFTSTVADFSYFKI